MLFAVCHHKIVDFPGCDAGGDGGSANIANLRAHPACFTHAGYLVAGFDVDFHITLLKASAFFSGP